LRNLEQKKIKKQFLFTLKLSALLNWEMKSVGALGPVVAPTADGVSTGALPLQIHHTFIQQRQIIKFCIPEI